MLLSLAVVSVWKGFGYSMLIFLAGLKAQPAEVHEAARIDGAGAWKSFWYVTLPLLKPVVFFVLVIETIVGFQVFDTIYVMTGGGPARASHSLIYFLFDEGFKFFDFGYASAIGIVLFVIVLILSLIQQRFFEGKDAMTSTAVSTPAVAAAQHPSRPRRAQPAREPRIAAQRTLTWVLAVISLFTVAPLIAVVILALSPADAPTIPYAIAVVADFDNIIRIFRVGEFPLWLWNSFLYSVVSVVIVLFTASMAAYALARKRFPGRNALLWSIIATLMVPMQATLIPTFILVAESGRREHPVGPDPADARERAGRLPDPAVRDGHAGRTLRRRPHRRRRRMADLRLDRAAADQARARNPRDLRLPLALERPALAVRRRPVRRGTDAHGGLRNVEHRDRVHVQRHGRNAGQLHPLPGDLRLPADAHRRQHHGQRGEGMTLVRAPPLRPHRRRLPARAAVYAALREWPRRRGPRRRVTHAWKGEPASDFPLSRDRIDDFAKRCAGRACPV